MNDKYKIFETLYIENLDFIGHFNTDELCRYLVENNIKTVSDIVYEIRKHLNENNCTTITSSLLGIVSLCVYKYCGVFSEDIIDLLNSEFKTNLVHHHSKEAQEDYKRFYLLGFSHYEITFLYTYYRNIKSDYTIINLLTHLITFESASLPKYLLNKCNVLVEYYDAFNKDYKSQMKI